MQFANVGVFVQNMDVMVWQYFELVLTHLLFLFIHELIFQAWIDNSIQFYSIIIRRPSNIIVIFVSYITDEFQKRNRNR